MSARGQGRSSAALAILAAVTVGAGLALTGGPLEGRALRRDDTRMEDLRRLSSRVQCLAMAQKRLPASVEESDVCPDPVRLTDPYTDAPYRYQRIDATNYRLCGVFERPRRQQQWSGDEFDAVRGCLVQRWYPEVADAPVALPSPAVEAAPAPAPGGEAVPVEDPPAEPAPPPAN